MDIWVTRPVEIYRGMSREELVAEGVERAGFSRGVAPRQSENVWYEDPGLAQFAAGEKKDLTSKRVQAFRASVLAMEAGHHTDASPSDGSWRISPAMNEDTAEHGE